MFGNKQSSDIAWNSAFLNCDPHPRINALSVAAHLLRPSVIGKQIPVDTFHSGDPMRVEEENERILFISSYFSFSVVVLFYFCFCRFRIVSSSTFKSTEILEIRGDSRARTG